MATGRDAQPALRFVRVSKRYGSAPALRDFTLDVCAGETFGLVGMNGAGKTTLIKCLLDFAEPDDGEIEVFGVSHRITHARTRLSFLPERFTPPYYLRGWDFLSYMLRLQGVVCDRQEAERMLQRLDLDVSALAKPVRAFSKGMTQKLGLAACLLARKDLYVLDEPISGLDPKARSLLKGLLKELRDGGRTIFFTSHVLADVEELCNRMAVIHDGALRFTGSPAELRGRHDDANLEKAFLACIEPSAELAA